MSLSRRRFFQILGSTVATSTVAAVFPWPFRSLSPAEAAEYTRYATGTWTPSCCNMCGGQCGILAYVENEQVRKIEPHAANPNNVANVSTSFAAAQAAGDRGRLCCKGNSGIRSVYDPDRVSSPLRRVGPRGSGQFVSITWDEAIAEVATRTQSVIDHYGARSVVWFGEDHSFTHIQQDFTDAIGSPNYHNHSNLCDTSRKAHYKATIGDERPLADMENCDLLLVWGWNFLSAIKWIHLPAIFTRARATNPNFKFVYIDPVFNTTAGKSDTWIAPRPGTDGALALALGKLIIDSGSYDTAFVASYSLGFAEYRKYLDGDGTYDAIPKTAAWAETITGVPAATITQLAADLTTAYAAGRKICIDTWSGPGHHSNATQGGRAINCLNLLFGALDRPGTLLAPLRNGPGRRGAVAGWPAKDGWRVDGRDDVTIPAVNPDGTSNPINGPIKKKYSFSHGSGIYCETRDAMIAQRDFVGNPYPIKCAFFVFQNFVMSTPNTQRNLDALNAMEFVVSVDTHLSETALMADIVIPGSNYLERIDFNPFWISFRSVGLRQPVVESWIGGMSETQFLLEVGNAMGLPGFKTNAGVNDSDAAMMSEEWTRFMATGNSGGPWNKQMTWAELKANGVWIETGATGGTQYTKYQATKTFGLTDTIGTVVAAAQTVYTVKGSDGKAKGIATGATMNVGDTYAVGFSTESRRGQFWSPTMNNYFTGVTIPAGVSAAGDNRYHPLPYYLPPVHAPTTQYPLYFVSWKDVEHTHTRTFNNDYLMEMKRDNRLFIHTTLAQSLTIAEDDWIFVKTAYGLVRARAHITDGIQPETVGFHRGFGHWGFGELAKGKGAHDGWLLPGKAEIHSGQAIHKEVACRIYKDL